VNLFPPREPASCMKFLSLRSLPRSLASAAPPSDKKVADLFFFPNPFVFSFEIGDFCLSSPLYDVKENRDVFFQSPLRSGFSDQQVYPSPQLILMLTSLSFGRRASVISRTRAPLFFFLYWTLVFFS